MDLGAQRRIIKIGYMPAAVNVSRGLGAIFEVADDNTYDTLSNIETIGTVTTMPSANTFTYLDFSGPQNARLYTSRHGRIVGLNGTFGSQPAEIEWMVEVSNSSIETHCISTGTLTTAIICPIAQNNMLLIDVLSFTSYLDVTNIGYQAPAFAAEATDYPQDNTQRHFILAQRFPTITKMVLVKITPSASGQVSITKVSAGYGNAGPNATAAQINAAWASRTPFAYDVYRVHLSVWNQRTNVYR